ncbi:MAG: hypothetical protein R3D71_06780 [Rickettsiales bacterium]
MSNDNNISTVMGSEYHDGNYKNKPEHKLTARIIKNKKSKNLGNPSWIDGNYGNIKCEEALWKAVITQALMDALSRCKKMESQYNKHEAIRWLTENNKDFIDVCLSAGLNPNYVRKKAKIAIYSNKRWRAEAGKGKRYLERKKYREKQIALENRKKSKKTSNMAMIFSIA